MHLFNSIMTAMSANKATKTGALAAVAGLLIGLGAALTHTTPAQAACAADPMDATIINCDDNMDTTGFDAGADDGFTVNVDVPIDDNPALDLNDGNTVNGNATITNTGGTAITAGSMNTLNLNDDVTGDTDGVNAADDNIINIADGATVAGDDEGVEVGDGNTIQVDGTIQGDANDGGLGHGILMGDNNTVTVSGTGSILLNPTTEDNGITGGDNNTITIEAGGLVESGGDGSSDGINVGDMNNITVDGTVDATDGDDGINAGSGTTVTVGGSVLAADEAIEVDGGSTITVTSTGLVESFTSAGEAMEIDGDGNTVTVQASGMDRGVVRNIGGDSAIWFGGDNNTALIAGDVIAGDGGFSDEGITGTGTGNDVTVQMGGLVDTKTNDGGDAIELGDAATVIVEDQGRVLGGVDGIAVGGGVGTFIQVNAGGEVIANDDAIEAGSGTGAGALRIVINNAGLLQGDMDSDNTGNGIKVGDYAVITNSATGIIESLGSDGIVGGNDVELINSGGIASGTDNPDAAVMLGDNAVVTNTSTGVIDGLTNSAAFAGVYLDANGTVFNDGLIMGGDSGVFLGGIDGYVLNSATGVIQSSQGYGVLLSNDNQTLDNYGLIEVTDKSTGMAGVYIEDGAQTVNNYGIIIGSNFSGIYSEDGGSTINNMATGEIYGGDNAGAGHGIELEVGGNTIVNDGLIDTMMMDGLDGIHANGSGDSITNNGQIVANEDGVEIDVGDGSTITNSATGTIIAGRAGIAITGDSDGNTIINAGLIETTTKMGGSAIFLDDTGDAAGGNDVVNEATGMLSGYEHGIHLIGQDGTEIDNAGSVAGMMNGIQVEQDSDDVTINNQATGSVVGDLNGIAVIDGDDNTNINNYGTVTGTMEDGISAVNSDDISIDNRPDSGLIDPLAPVTPTQPVISGAVNGVSFDVDSDGNTITNGFFPETEFFDPMDPMVSTGFAGPVGGLIDGGTNGVLLAGDSNSVLNEGDGDKTTEAGDALISGGEVGVLVSGNDNGIFNGISAGLKSAADGFGGLPTTPTSPFAGGVISGGNYGVKVEDGAGSSTLITNYGGVIRGGTASVMGGDGDEYVLVEDGLMDGDILLGAGTDGLLLVNSAMVMGTIDMGDGTDDLALAGTGVLDSDVLNNEELVVLNDVDGPGGVAAIPGDSKFVINGTVTASSFTEVYGFGGGTQYLIVDGTLETGDLDVNSGGGLGGSGLVDLGGPGTEADINSGGFIAPGNMDVGTLTIDGDFELNFGATGQFEVGVPGGSNQLIVTGDADIDDRDDIQPMGFLTSSIGDEYVIIDAGSVSGDTGDQQFGSALGDFVYTIDVNTTDDNVTVTLDGGLGCAKLGMYVRCFNGDADGVADDANMDGIVDAGDLDDSIGGPLADGNTALHDYDGFDAFAAGMEDGLFILVDPGAIVDNSQGGSSAFIFQHDNILFNNGGMVTGRNHAVVGNDGNTVIAMNGGVFMSEINHTVFLNNNNTILVGAPGGCPDGFTCEKQLDVDMNPVNDGEISGGDGLGNFNAIRLEGSGNVVGIGGFDFDPANALPGQGVVSTLEKVGGDAIYIEGDDNMVAVNAGGSVLSNAHGIVLVGAGGDAEVNTVLVAGSVRANGTAIEAQGGLVADISGTLVSDLDNDGSGIAISGDGDNSQQVTVRGTADIQGDIDLGANTDGQVDVVIIDADTDGSYGGPAGEFSMTNVDELWKTGSGGFTLTGLGNEVSTGAYVLQGSLFIGDDEAVGSTLTVPQVTVFGNAGTTGLLGGVGTVVGDVNILGVNMDGDPVGSGILEAGNSIGQMDIDGDLAFDPIVLDDMDNVVNAGGQYQAEVNDGGANDVVNVTGTASLAGTLLVRPDAELTDNGDGTFTVGADFGEEAFVYDVLVADGGLATDGAGNVIEFQEELVSEPVVVADDPMTMEDETQTQPILKAFLEYGDFVGGDGVAETVRITSIPEFARDAVTMNQTSTAEYVDSLTQYGLHQDDLHFVAKELGLAADIPEGLDDLHGEWYNAFTEVGLEMARQQMEQVWHRTSDARLGNRGATNVVWTPGQDASVGDSGNPRAAFWAAGQWDTTDIDESKDGFFGYDFDTYGFMAGFDYLVSDNILVGIFAGYNDSDVEWDDRTGDGSADGFSFGGYASFWGDRWYIDISGGYGDLDIKSDRDISFGLIQRTASAEYDGDYYHFEGRGGYHFDVANNGLMLTPTLGLAYINVDQDAFVETGAGSINLAIDEQSHDSFRLDAQLMIWKAFEGGNSSSTFVPYARLGIAHEFEDDLRAITGRFEGQASDFTVYGEVGAQTTAVFGVGVSALLSEMFTLFLDYSGEIGGDYSSHGVRGGVRVNF